MSQAVAIGIGVLTEAKEHCQGCGGDSHVSVLTKDGHLFYVPADEIAAYEVATKSIEHFARRTMFFAFDRTMNDDELKVELRSYVTPLSKARRILFDATPASATSSSSDHT